jgi:hypothetical protein
MELRDAAGAASGQGAMKGGVLGGAAVVLTDQDDVVTVDGNEARLEISGSDDYEDCDET